MTCSRGPDCEFCKTLTPDELEMARKYWETRTEVVETALDSEQNKRVFRGIGSE